jgi:hypothetical protein
MKKIILGLMSFCLLTSGAAQAQERACTQIGCMNGLTLQVDPDYDWKRGQYEFEFVLDNRKVRCWGELPLNAYGEGSTVSCNKQGVTITESGCALPETRQGFGDIYIEGEPRRVMVRVSYNNRAIVTRSISADYKISRPNGPGCGPVCNFAAYNLFSAD